MDCVKSVDQPQIEAAEGELGNTFSPRPSDHVNAKKRLIDTAAPFQSVKEAVSKFGGTVDWKANRSLSMERRKAAEPKLENTEETQLPNNDLEGTKKLIDELKLSLEKVQKEEHKAKQDSELMTLKVLEMEQNIANEASVAAKAQLEVDEASHAAALLDLKTMEEELEALSKEYASIVIERDIAIKEAEEAVAASKEVERTVEDLASELIATKESIESAQTTHLELERERTNAAMVKDLKSKLEASSSLLLDLKAKLSASMQSKLKQQCDEEQRKELEEVKLKIEKAIAEVNCLRVASMSLKSKLEEEKSVITIRQREEMAAALVQAKEKMIELPKKLQEAVQEADHAKMLAREAHLELNKAKEEAEQAKDNAIDMESRLLAAQQEIEAVKASEKLAIAATKSLQESESARSNSDVESPSEVTLSIEQYDQLCKLAHEANEEANLRVAAANSQIDMAKESELRSWKRLEELNQELAERRKSLKEAAQKAEKAKEGKLSVEQELRKWRAEQEQRRKTSEVNQEKINQNKNSKSGSEGKKGLKNLDPASNKTGTGASSETKTKKKKSFSSRIMMFFSKRKTHPAK